MDDTKIKIDVEYLSVKDLQKAIKAAKDEMVGLEEGSDAFKLAAKNAGELLHQMQAIQEAVRGASTDFGDMIGNVAKAGAGITGAFQAAQGAMKLFGAESEDVAKAIEKMQSLMALTQGLSSIDQGIKAFGKLKTAIGLNSTALGGFKKALIGTGLGALVVVLGSIIANWDEFTEAIGLSSELMNKLGEVWGGIQNVLLKGIKGIALSVAGVIKGIKDSFSDVIGGIGDAFQALFSGDFGGVKKAFAGIKNDITSSFSKAFDGLGEYFDVTANYAEGVQNAITTREKEELLKRKEAYAKYVDDREKELDRLRSKAEATIDDEKERTNELIRIEQERLKLYAEGSKEYYDQLKKIKDLQASLTEESTTNEEDPEITKLRNRVQALKDSYRDEIQVINDEEANKLAAIREAQKNELITKQEFEDLKTQIEKEAADKRAKIQQDEADLAAEYSRMKMEAGLQMANNFAAIFSAMADIIGEDSEEAFKAAQAFQISSAIINTLAGAIGAYTGAASNQAINSIPYVGPIIAQALGITSAAAVAATGAVQIAQISRRKWNDRSTSGLSASTGSSRANITSAATSAASPVQYTQDVQGGSIEDAIKDTRVYVTESDISNTQKKVNVAESESRF